MELTSIDVTPDSRKFLIGITVKSVNEDEETGKLFISTTIIVKSTALPKEISLNMNKDGNFIPEMRNRKLVKGLETMSFHYNAELRSIEDRDRCPYILSTYSLSIKINAEDNSSKPSGKVKHLFEERALQEFIQFQSNSVESGISLSDSVSIFPVSKDKTTWDEAEEVDEIVVEFTTRRKQVFCLTKTCIPCLVVPLILSEMMRIEELNSEALLTGFLTLIFSMPDKFGSGTSIWYISSVIFCLIVYVGTSYYASTISSCVIVYNFALFVYYFHKQKRDWREDNTVRSLMKGRKPPLTYKEQLFWE